MLFPFFVSIHMMLTFLSIWLSALYMKTNYKSI